MKSQLFLIGLIGLFMLSSCSGEEENLSPKPIEGEQTEEKQTEEEIPNRNTRVDVPLSDRQKELMGYKQTFDLNFFKSVYAKARNEEQKQFAVSPYSASVFMAMLAEGADDAVRAEMMKAFIPAGATIDETADLMKLMSESLSDMDNTVKFMESNSVWFDNSKTLGKDFADRVAQYYNASIFQCDMFSSSTTDRINSWVYDTSDGMIENIYDQAPQSFASLIDVLSFKGQWYTPFEEENTTRATFHNASGTETEVDMMCASMHNYAAQGDGYKIVGLPYGNLAYTMFVILPDNSVDEFVASLTPDKWKKMRNTGVSDIDIKLPKFTLKSEKLNLNEALKTIGFEANFSKETSYDRICSGLNGAQMKVNQSVTLKIDETGTEGAAATWNFWISSDLGAQPKPMEFTVDRPFIFIIDELSTGAIIFAGVVNEF